LIEGLIASIQELMASLNLSAIDLLLLVAVAVSGLYGLSKGFVEETLGIAVFLLAIVLAFRLPHTITPFLEPWISNPLVRLVAGGVVIGIVSAFIGIKIVDTISSFLKKARLDGTNRTMGLLFGFFRGAVILILLASFLRPTMGDMDWWQNSRVISVLQPYERFTTDLFKQLLDNYSEHLKVSDE